MRRTIPEVGVGGEHTLCLNLSGLVRSTLDFCKDGEEDLGVLFLTDPLSSAPEQREEPAATAAPGKATLPKRCHCHAHQQGQNPP